MRWMILLFPTIAVFSEPLPLSIIHGDAAFKHSPNLLEITSADQSIIEWGQFNIESSETVRFIQPSETATVLNRVLDSSPSRLLGRLESNGQLILINPNGILVGRDAAIAVSSLIAASLDLQNDAFLSAKEWRFAGESSSFIENHGSIRVRNGRAALIGMGILHAGSIDAEGGYCALLAGNEVIMKADSSSPIYIRTHNPNSENPFAGAFKPSAVTVEGSIVAPGSEVYVMGDRIWLKNGSMIDASHDLNAGTIRIGGDFQGANPDFQNAEYLLFEREAKIFADTRIDGRGGRVILWSDDSNAALGSIYARGGMFNGDGGFAEISAPSLFFDGIADLSSSKGIAGMLLLDPTDITIGAAACPTATIGCPSDSWALCGCPVNFLAAGVGSITAVLAGGTSVCIDTSTPPNLSCPGLGTITLAAGNPISWNSAASLTLTADQDILLFSAIQNEGTGAVTLDAGRNITITAGASPADFAGAGSLQGATTVTAGGDITMNGGVLQSPAIIGFSITANDQTSQNDITVQCNNLIMNGNVNGREGGSIIGHGSFPIAGNRFFTNSNIFVTTAGDINLNFISGAMLNDKYNVVAIGHGANFLDALSVLNGNITVNCNGNITFDMTGAGIEVGQVDGIGHTIWDQSHPSATVAGNISVIALGNITFIPPPASAGGFTLHGIGHGMGNITSLSGDVDVQAGGTIFMQNSSPQNPDRLYIGHLAAGMAMSYSGNISVSAGQDILINGGNSTGGYSLIGYNSNATVSISGNISVAAGRDIIMTGGTSAGAGNTGPLIGTISGGGAAYTGDTFVAAGRNVSISSPFLAGINSHQNVTVASGGNISLAGSNTAGTNAVFIGSELSLFSTTIYARGNISAANGSMGSAILGKGSQLPANANLDMRAKGDIQMAVGFSTGSTGFIFIEADSQFDAAGLWQVSGGQMTSIAGIALPASIPLLNPGFASSSAIPSNGLGAFSISPTAAAPIALQTLSGAITLHSAPVRVNSNSQNLNIGCNPGNDVCLTTTSGDIEVFGIRIPGQCQTGDSFFNITINQDICTSGTVLISASNNLTMSAVSSIGGPSCAGLIPSSVTLICDNQAPYPSFAGSGAFAMLAGSSINTTGPLRIYTAHQHLNTINGSLNGSAFGAGTLFSNTCAEQWCSYFCDLNNLCPGSNPFSIFYKTCLQILTNQALRITEELLEKLHPEKEFPGWNVVFSLMNRANGYEDLPAETFFLSRRNLKYFNQPKTWTTLLPE